jgi:hypothetical protein
MKSYSTILEDEPEVMHLTGHQETQVLLQKQRAINSILNFLIYSSPSTSVSLLSLPYINPYYSSDTSVTINKYSDIEFLDDAFELVNPQSIRQFLFFHPEIIPSILECHVEILTRFNLVIPKMELIVDVEQPDWKTIFITIPHQLEYEEAFEKLNDLLRNWAFYQPEIFKRLVTITVE